MRLSTSIAIVATLSVGVATCRKFSYVGVRCGQGEQPCPSDLPCRALPNAPDAGLFCLPPIESPGDGGADAGADADSGADAGADADAGAEADSGTDAGVGADAGAATDSGADAGADGGGAAADASVRSWSDASAIDNQPLGFASSPAVGIDSTGNAVAVWIRGDPDAGAIMSSRLEVPQQLWEQPTAISRPNARSLSRPEIVVAPAGSAVVVWTERGDTGRIDLWSNRLGAQWGDAGLLEANSVSDVTTPDIASDGEGNAVVVWSQDPSGGPRIWARRYVIASDSWEATVLVSGSFSYAAFTPQIALDPAGNGAAVWYDGMGDEARAYSNRFDRDAGRWSDAGLLGFDVGSSYSLGVAAGLSGDLVAVSRQAEAGNNALYARRVDPGGTGWSAPTLLTVIDGGPPDGFQVRATGSGDFTALWIEQKTGNDRVMAGRYLATSAGWTLDTLPDPIGSNNAQTPWLATDSAGNAFAVYRLWDGSRYQLWMARYVFGQAGWASVGLMDVGDEGTVSAARVAANTGGQAVLVWSQAAQPEDAGKIWARVFK